MEEKMENERKYEEEEQYEEQEDFDLIGEPFPWYED